MGTEAQNAANARNAQKSTGPRTGEGKHRSSRNAVVHGGFAEEIDPVTASLLMEDYDELEELASALLDELNPITPLEESLALALVHRIISQRRVGRLEAPLAEGEAEFEDAPRELSSTEVTAAVHSLITTALLMIRQGDESCLDFRKLTVAIWSYFVPGVEVKCRYLNGQVREPASPAEWREAFLTAVKEQWGEGDTLAAALTAHFPALEEVRRAARGHQAARLLAHLDNLSRLRERVDRSVERALRNYRLTWERNEEEGVHERYQADSRNEPNPTA